MVTRRLSSQSVISDVLDFLLASSGRATRALAEAHQEKLIELAGAPDDGFPLADLDLG